MRQLLDQGLDETNLHQPPTRLTLRQDHDMNSPDFGLTTLTELRTAALKINRRSMVKLPSSVQGGGEGKKSKTALVV